MKGTEMYELSGRAEGVDWSDVAMAGRAYADNIVGEPAVTAAMHSMADEIERLRTQGNGLADRVNSLLAERQDLYRHIANKEPWIPVSERLPEEGERVLYYNGDCGWDYGSMVRIGICIDDGPTGTREMRICELGITDMTAPEHRATHWMPLPEPPKTL